MKTNHPFHSTRTHWTTALTCAAATFALTLTAQAGTLYQDIKVTITLDREHMSIADRMPTGQGVNELRGDNPNASTVAYTDGGSGKKILARVGRNRHISLDGNTSSQITAGRTAFLDLTGRVGCPDSVRVEIDGIAGCDPCTDMTPPLPDSRFGALDTDDVSGFPDNFSLQISGEDF